MKEDNSKAVIQALSLQVTHLLSKGVRNGSLAAKDLEVSLLLEGRTFTDYFNDLFGFQ